MLQENKHSHPHSESPTAIPHIKTPRLVPSLPIKPITLKKLLYFIYLIEPLNFFIIFDILYI